MVVQISSWHRVLIIESPDFCFDVSLPPNIEIGFFVDVAAKLPKKFDADVVFALLNADASELSCGDFAADGVENSLSFINKNVLHIVAGAELPKRVLDLVLPIVDDGSKELLKDFEAPAWLNKLGAVVINVAALLVSNENGELGAIAIFVVGVFGFETISREFLLFKLIILKLKL